MLLVSDVSYWPFYIRDALSDWDDFGQRYLVCLFISSRIKTGTRLIIHLDELNHLVRPLGRTKAGNLSKRIIHLVPVFIRYETDVLNIFAQSRL